MSQLVDFLMIGMVGVGGLFVFFNWEEVQGWLGGGSGSNANCSWDSSGHHCWQGKCGTATFKSCLTEDKDNTSDHVAGCAQARKLFLEKHTNCGTPASCSGGYVPTTGGCVCNNQVKGCTGANSCIRITPTSCGCWKAGTTEVGSGSGCPTGQYRCKLASGGCGCCTLPGGGCKNGFMPCTGGCCCNRELKKCGAGQIAVIVGSGASATCGCYNCNTGFIRQGDKCVPNTGGNITACGKQGNAAQAWIARTANAILGRMCGCTKIPSIGDIEQKWPSLTAQLAVENQCNTNKLHVSYPIFNKHYAQLLQAIAVAYRTPISAAAGTALSGQQTTGVWRLAAWDSTIIGYRARVDHRTGRGKAYSATLSGRENMWDLYGDQRYAFTLPKEGMKVKVSN